MLDFAKTLRNHWMKIINWHNCEITTGPLDGLKNKIKTLKRKSYGFRDQQYIKLKIFAIYKTRYELVGCPNGFFFNSNFSPSCQGYVISRLYPKLSTTVRKTQ